MPEWSAAISAGGQSRRFGSDKGAALLCGQTLLWHAAQALVQADEHLLIAPPGRVFLAGWQTVPDTRPGLGPLAALEAALSAAHCDWVAFAGVDMPTLTPAYWQALLARTPDALAVQAQHPQRGPQPLGALYHRRLLPHITALLDSGERRLRAACPAPAVALVADLPEKYFWNVNTPQELDQLQAWQMDRGGQV